MKVDFKNRVAVDGVAFGAAQVDFIGREFSKSQA